MNRRLSMMAPYQAPALLILVEAVVVRVHGQIRYADPGTFLGDHNKYLAMAVQPFGSPDPLAQFRQLPGVP